MLLIVIVTEFRQKEFSFLVSSFWSFALFQGFLLIKDKLKLKKKYISIWIYFNSSVVYDFYGFDPMTIYNLYHGFFLFFVYFLPLTIFIIAYRKVTNALKR